MLILKISLKYILILLILTIKSLLLSIFEISAFLIINLNSNLGIFNFATSFHYGIQPYKLFYLLLSGRMANENIEFFIFGLLILTV